MAKAFIGVQGERLFLQSVRVNYYARLYNVEIRTHLLLEHGNSWDMSSWLLFCSLHVFMEPKTSETLWSGQCLGWKRVRCDWTLHGLGSALSKHCVLSQREMVCKWRKLRHAMWDRLQHISNPNCMQAQPRVLSLLWMKEPKFLPALLSCSLFK